MADSVQRAHLKSMYSILFIKLLLIV